MDLMKELLESNNDKRRKGWRPVVGSLALHALLVASVVYAGSERLAHKVDSESKIDAFLSRGAAPPPPPPPPPPKRGGAKATPQVQKPKPVEVPRTPQLIAPTEIPQEIPPVRLPDATQSLPVVESTDAGVDTGVGDAVNGVAGGVEGGVAGGVVGGVVGGVEGGEVGGVIGGVVGGIVDGTGSGSGEAAPPPPPPPPPPPEPSGPLRVGGNVKAPVAIERAEPDYTAPARKAKASGTVVVEAIIDKDGRVRDVRVIKGLGFGLSDAAEAAVKKWRFRPGTLNGEPVATIFNLTVTFRMNE